MYTLNAPGILRKYLILTISIFRHLHKTGLVPAPVAVIGCRPHCHQIPLFEPSLVPRFHQLMRPHYHFQPVMLYKLRSGTAAKEPAHASAAQHPAFNLIRVRPHDVPETSNSRNLAYSVDISDVFKRMDIGGKPSVEAENLIWGRWRDTVDEGCERKVVEKLIA